jgi:hypothetical protein
VAPTAITAASISFGANVRSPVLIAMPLLASILVTP